MKAQRLVTRDGRTGSVRRRMAAVLVWVGVSILLYLTLADFYQGAVLMGNPVSFESIRQVVFWTAMIPALGIWGYLLYSAASGKFPVRLLHRLSGLRARAPGPLRALLALAFILFPAYLFLYSPAGGYALGYWSRLGTVLFSASLAAVVAFRFTSWRAWLLAVSGAVLTVGAIFTAASWLNQVTSYPFSLGWSEGNRIYDYSMLFGSRRYPGLEKPGQTFIALGRQVLWALPFLLPNINLWGMRLWDALLWILPGLLLGWFALPGNLGRGNWLSRLVFSLWVFVFIAQGPVYAPLVVAAGLVVLAVRMRSLPLAALLVAAAAYYASISRYTWTYAPGLWAGMLALLDVQTPSLRPNRWKSLLRPVVLGLCGYTGGELLPDFLKWLASGGQPGKISLMIDAGAAVSRQPLLWERLWPNSTYAPGILIGTLWAGLPVAALLVYLAVRRIWRLNWLQALAAAAVSLAFLAVGVVVSVKIGGGSNLHNLDMFWLTLVLLAGRALQPLFQNGAEAVLRGRLLPAALLCAALVFPITYTIPYGERLTPPAGQAKEALTAIRAQVAEAGRRGEVLFIDQRQLVTFGLVPPVPFILDYEKKLLMDQAMAGNSRYFEAFHRDLENQRFELIITEPVRVNYISNKERNFVEENNAWVEWVSAPILEYYQPLETYEQVGVQILVPKR